MSQDWLRLSRRVVLLLVAQDDPVDRFQVASALWTARYTLERRATIHETALIASQFAAMQTTARRAAIRTLGDHFQARRSMTSRAPHVVGRDRRFPGSAHPIVVVALRAKGV